MIKFLLLLLSILPFGLAFSQWNKISNYPPDNSNSLEKISFIDGKEGYVAFSGYLAYTQDSGKNLVTRTVDVPEFPFKRFLFNGLAVVDNTTLLLYGQEGYVTPFIFRSIDKGLTWQTVFTTSIASPQQVGAGITHLLMLDKLNGYALYKGNTLMTTNGGVTWTNRFTYTNDEFNSISGFAAGDVWATGGLSLYKILSTGSSRQTFLQGQVQNVCSAAPDKIYLSADDGIYYSADNGANWTKKTREGENSPNISSWYFVNESTGYAVIENRIYQTKDYALTWELMKADYPAVSSNGDIKTLFFQNAQLAYAGGNGPVLYKTENGGGAPYPKASFAADNSTIARDSIIKLNNFSYSQYDFKWLRNGKLLSASYNTTYKTNRDRKDTITLIVSNTTGSDTAIQYVETRTPDYNCDAFFNFSQDTSTIKLFPRSQPDYRTHKWLMGNEVLLTDSVPVYQYSKRGTYTITHIVNDPISGCSSTFERQVNIRELTRCDGLINPIHHIDTFRTNLVRFYGQLYDSYYSSSSQLNLSKYKWFYGDGDSSENIEDGPTHTYANKGTYYVRLDVNYNNELCKKVFYDTVIIALDDCNARFTNYGGTQGISEFSSWYGKPLNNPESKRHSWVLDNKDTIKTSFNPNIDINYSYKQDWIQTCYSSPYGWYGIHNIDSASRKIKHIVTDVTTGCYAADSMIVSLSYGNKSMVIYQSYNNPYSFNFNIWVNEYNTQCLTIEGLPGSAGSNSPSFIKYISKPGVYWANAISTYPFYDVYRRRIVVDGEYRYFNGSPMNEVVGKIFIDANNNGIFDNGELLYKQPAKITGSDETNKQIVYNENGCFRYAIGQSTNNVTTNLTLQKPYYTITPAIKTSEFANKAGLSDTVNFALVPKKIKDGSINIIPLTAARPGMRSIYQLSLSNSATDTLADLKVVLVKDRRIAFQSFTADPVLENEDSVIFSIKSLLPGETKYITLNGTLQVPPALNINDTLLFKAAIEVPGDTDTSDNAYVLKQRVTGSFDPNDKSDNYGGKLNFEGINSGAWLHYLVRFQNTGNDTAFNIIVRDTLPGNLDLSTFEMVEASHAYKLSINNNNEMEWLFKSIMLPDSSKNEALSHGYILYRIKPKQTLMGGDSIVNSAAIYFDFNQPVNTNKAITKVAERGVTLPVKLITLTAMPVNNKYISVKWKIDANTYQGFEVERSKDGLTYEKIGWVPAQANSTSETAYNFNDYNADKANRYYYRLKIITLDNNWEYSYVVKSNLFRNTKQLIITPNPGNGKFNVFIDNITGKTILSVYDAAGKVCFNKSVSANRSINEAIDLTHLTSGIYIVKITNNSDVFTERLIINK